MPKKKKAKKKMPGAPIQPNVSNIKGIGKQGPINGGVSFMTKNPGNRAADTAIIKGLLRIN
jgi:hypothetical protein